MRPYYEDAKSGIVIYHGDCREILPTLAPVDLVLTDPPYGINAGRLNFGMWRTSRMAKSDWDKEAPPQWLLYMAMDRAANSIVWGGNYFGLPPTRNFLVWDKGAGFKGRDFAECEQAWCSWDANARVFTRDPLAAGDYRDKVHPTQKPLPLMKWCIEIAGDEVNTILDPFMGSGTTLRAAKDLGKKCIGIEINEAYCEAAVSRLAQGVLFGAECP